MIKGTFKRNDSGRIVSFELAGHAQAGEYGKDIVCAAASALAISAALAGVAPKVEADNENGGYLLVTLPSRLTQEQSNIAQILLENLLIGLQSVQEEYNDYIQIKTTKEN